MYPLHHYGWSDLRALRSGRYKVIDAPRPELYDIDRDPHEATNLFSERRPLGERMIGQLRSMEERFNKTVAALPAADVDPEARERLAALGYVGSFVASASDPGPGAPIRRTRSASSTSSAPRPTSRKNADDDREGTVRSRSSRLLNEVVRDDPR